MPKVKKISSAIHPNSRKASQMARQIFHNEKLEKRKGESNVKQKVKCTKMKWFKENVDATKDIYSGVEVKELIDRYLNRFKENTEMQKETKSLKRHLSTATFLDYKTKFLVEKEKHEFETSGLEIPDLMQKKTYDVFKAWNGDTQLLTAITTTTVSKKQLEKYMSKNAKENST